MEKGGSNEIRYFSMFTGVGGFELGLDGANRKLGLKNANDISETQRNESRRDEIHCSSTQPELLASKQFTCVGLSEWDKYSSQVLRYRFPNIKNWGDCTKINPDELPDFDMLCGGFPCQSFSIAGKRRGFEDTRGTMFFEVARILKVKRPKIVLLENVKGLLNHNKGETFSVILEALDELGYEVQWMVLNSKFFGVPQNRERVLIIGSLRGERRPEILPFGEVYRENNELCRHQETTNTIHTRITADSNGTYIEGGRSPQVMAWSKSIGMDNGKLRNEQGVKTTGEFNTLSGGDGCGNYSSKNFIAEDKLIMDLYNNKEHSDRCPALTEPHHNTLRVKEGTQIRRLTPVECCRLQGFPDDWNEWGIDEQGIKVKMSDTQRYKQMGNAVTTNVIKAVGEKLL